MPTELHPTWAGSTVCHHRLGVAAHPDIRKMWKSSSVGNAQARSGVRRAERAWCSKDRNPPCELPLLEAGMVMTLVSQRRDCRRHAACRSQQKPGLRVQEQRTTPGRMAGRPDRSRQGEKEAWSVQEEEAQTLGSEVPAATGRAGLSSGPHWTGGHDAESSSSPVRVTQDTHCASQGCPGRPPGGPRVADRPGGEEHTPCSTCRRKSLFLDRFADRLTDGARRF